MPENLDKEWQKGRWQRIHLSVNGRTSFSCLIVLTGAFLQGVLAATKTTITHDETISYLSAVGRQGDFERIFRDNVYPANHWATVGEWQAWFAIDTPFAFRQIGRDLAESDIHPPLYFLAAARVDRAVWRASLDGTNAQHAAGKQWVPGDCLCWPARR
jgi:hypothetical protein